MFEPAVCITHAHCAIYINKRESPLVCSLVCHDFTSSLLSFSLSSSIPPIPPPRELKSCTARPRLGLTISFASLTTSLTTSAIYINKRESALVSHNFTILPPSILPSTKCARKSGAWICSLTTFTARPKLGGAFPWLQGAGEECMGMHDRGQWPRSDKWKSLLHPPLLYTVFLLSPPAIERWQVCFDLYSTL